MQDIISNHGNAWAILAGALHLLVSIPTAIHALLHKDDERAATGWIGLVFLSPFLGSALYWMFGINRVKSRAKTAKADRKKTILFSRGESEVAAGFQEQWLALMRAGYAIHDAPYLPGNQVTPLINGDEAYPRMLDAINRAEHDIILSSYIFDCDRAGRKFIDALGAAKKRKVAVHVLIDGVFLAHRWRKTQKELRRLGVTTARFFPFSPRFINLRNHRKILCADGAVAFIGGLNIRQANMVGENPRNPVQDIHFEIKGPAVDQISKVFTDDWHFATGKPLDFSQWSGAGSGHVLCRVLPDGPDEDYQKLEWTLLAAVNCAERNIRIMMPYFIPDRTLIRALQAASLRGVNVEVMVPAKNNILFFNWAMQADFKDLLEFGLKIHLSPPPFEHSKLFIVDDGWSFIGSANWDARSLALNYEINLECYDGALNEILIQIFEERRKKSKTVSKTFFDHYPILMQIRNNFFHLFSPYL